MESYWTKRRKVQSKVREHVAAIDSSSLQSLNSMRDNSYSIDSENEDLNLCMIENNEHAQQVEIESDASRNQIDTAIRNVSSKGDNSFECAMELTDDNSTVQHEVNTETFETDTSSDTDNETVELTDILVPWVSKFNISHSALNGLLSILRPYHDTLPRDARTLLKTTKQYCILSIAGGSYYHFGIETWVKSIIESHPVLKANSNIEEVSMQINIDGLPLFKSSNMQLWPILGRLVKPILSRPFVIGLYSGKQKPTNVHEYTEKLISELRDLFQNGILISGIEDIRPRFSLSCIICDSPAKSFVKQIKGHSGYSSCNNCVQRGEWRNKMTFPETDAPLRTDIQFDEMRDEDHHLGPSPFRCLPIGMVSQFPMDFMHLVCLGVVKRLIWLWMKGPVAISCRLGAGTVQEISDALVALQSYLPREFNRKGRPLSEVDRWKASEFRQFLLYTGPVVLRSIVPVRTYKHFLLLFVGIFCLSCNFFCNRYNDYAHQILCQFVQQFGELYGEDMLVSNVHGLVHLAKDVKKFGPLDNFSAFVFESFLGNLKRLIRRPTLPLQQVIRRISESKGNIFDPTVHIASDETGIFRKVHENGIIPINLKDRITCQYKEIIFPDHCLSIKRGDNCFLINDEVAIVKNILSLSESPEKVVVYQKFINVSNFFIWPLLSSDLRIVHVRNLSKNLHVASFLEISCKCVMLPLTDGYVCIPLVHTFN